MFNHLAKTLVLFAAMLVSMVYFAYFIPFEGNELSVRVGRFTMLLMVVGVCVEVVRIVYVSKLSPNRMAVLSVAMTMLSIATVWVAWIAGGVFS